MVNETIPILIEPMSSTISSLVSVVSAGIGGIFGLYVVLVILKWRELRMLKKTMSEIKGELKILNEAVSKIENRVEKKTTGTPKKR